MSFLNTKNRTKKLCGIMIFIITFLFISPQKGMAQYIDISQAAKEYGLDSLASILAKNILTRITAQTVNWINSGFQGNPAYVTDPGQFFLGIADTEASRLLSTSGLSNLCGPFRAQVRLALVKNYLAETDNQYYSCSLGTLEQNYNSFINDFSQGGWDGWFSVTQNNQNNPYGTYLDTKNQLSVNIGNQKEKYQKQLDQGGGFLSFEKCDTNAPGYIAARTVAGVNIPESCTKKETVTPGSVINDQLKKALGSTWGQLEAADELNEIISALFEQLVGKIAGGIGNGLRGASDNGSSGTGSTARSFTDDLITESEAPIAPVITPHLSNPIRLVIGTDADLGASAYDVVDGDISASIETSGMGDITVPGTFTITYNVTNSQGVSANEVTRTVNVVSPPDVPAETPPTESAPTPAQTTSPTGNANSTPTGPTPPSNGVSLSASPSSGPAPLGNVTLSATNSGSGQFYYYFYCNRTQVDPSEQVPTGFINSPMIITQNTYSSSVQCSYNTSGTYYPKVISWLIYDTAGNYIGGNGGAWRQANATVTVQ